MKSNHAEHRVDTSCRVLGVSPTRYYAPRRRGRSGRTRRHEESSTTIPLIPRAFWGTYEVPRADAELAAGGVQVSREPVASSHRSARTPRVDRNHRATPHRIERRFGADAPNLIWVADIIYAPTWFTLVYLAVVLELSRRKVVAPPWLIILAPSSCSPPSTSRCNHAAPNGRPSLRHRFALHLLGLREELWLLTSTGSPGYCVEKAMALSFFATPECELIRHPTLQSHAKVRGAVFRYIEGWYDTARRHSSSACLGPNACHHPTAVRPGRPAPERNDRTRPFLARQPDVYNYPPRLLSVAMTERALLVRPVARVCFLPTVANCPLETATLPNAALERPTRSTAHLHRRSGRSCQPPRQPRSFCPTVWIWNARRQRAQQSPRTHSPTISVSYS